MPRSVSNEFPRADAGFLSAVCLAVAACASGDRATERVPAPDPPVTGAVLVNELIQPGETHFKNLWRLTFGGQNAEAYWNYADDRLSLQITSDPSGLCQIRTGADGGVRQVERA